MALNGYLVRADVGVKALQVPPVGDLVTHSTANPAISPPPTARHYAKLATMDTRQLLTMALHADRFPFGYLTHMLTK
jgi:hypothetical protein